MKLMKWATALALSLLLTACGLGSSAKSTVEDFYWDVNKGKVSSALEKISPATRKMMGEAKFRAAIESQAQKFQNHGGLKKVEIEGEELAETARFQVKLIMNDGETLHDKANVSKIEGRWYIGMGM